MKILITRINKGEVLVNNSVISSINKGLAVFVGLEINDTADTFPKICEKIINLRIFEDDRGKFYYSVKDKCYALLCISNFTLCANTDGGRRPAFDNAMLKDQANNLFSKFIETIKTHGLEVQTGSFGEHMDIKLDLDGPVNIIL